MLAGIVFYILTVNGIVDEKFSELEVYDLYLSTPIGLAIFIGLWRLKPWGWKLAVIFIPLSWSIGLIELYSDYYRGLGLITAPFIIVDALILNYLFKPKVHQFLKISSSPLLRLQWLVKVLFLLALFVAVKDIFGGLVGLITVTVVLLGVGTARKTIKTIEKTHDLTSG